jgi:hypothetical protein
MSFRDGHDVDMSDLEAEIWKLLEHVADLQRRVIALENPVTREEPTSSPYDLSAGRRR